MVTDAQKHNQIPFLSQQLTIPRGTQKARLGRVQFISQLAFFSILNQAVGSKFFFLSGFKELEKTYHKCSSPKPEYSFVWSTDNVIFEKPFQHSPTPTKTKAILRKKNN